MLVAAALTLVAASPHGPTVVTDVRVHPELDGVTLVEVEATETAVPYSYRPYTDPDGTCRGVLRLRGVAEPFPITTIPVRDCNLAQVRIGYHPELETPELHLVFDLANPQVAVLSISRENATLLVRIGRRVGRPTPSPTFPQATPPPPPTSTPTPTASPPQPTPTPTAVPSPTATATAPPTPTSARQTSPPASTAASQPQPYPRPLDRWQGGTGSPPPPAGTTASAILEIVVSQRVDGSTLLRVTTDQALQRHAVLDFGDPRDPTRHVLLLLGIRAAEIPTLLEVDDTNLRAVQVTTAGEGRPAETQLGLLLTSCRVQVTQIATNGPHLVVVLTPREGG